MWEILKECKNEQLFYQREENIAGKHKLKVFNSRRELISHAESSD